MKDVIFNLQCVKYGLVNLLVYISDNTSDVETEDKSIMYESKRRWFCEIFNISLSIRGFHEIKPRMHASFVGDSSICFSDKKSSETAQEQEQRFRGSISLTTNDGILSAYSLVLVIFMLK